MKDKPNLQNLPMGTEAARRIRDAFRREHPELIETWRRTHQPVLVVGGKLFDHQLDVLRRVLESPNATIIVATSSRQVTMQRPTEAEILASLTDKTLLFRQMVECMPQEPMADVQRPKNKPWYRQIVGGKKPRW